MKFLCIMFVVVALGAGGARAWEEVEMEIFDLVEEVNTIEKNFYEYMGVANDANAGDIRKAYRKLSLTLHPDKSDAEDAETKFRWLAGINDVLKDKAKREIYDRVLVEGLPDWRMPAFYFRRMRKINLAEGLVYLFLIVTLCQYFVNWAAYWERKWTLSEVVEGHAKKMAKRVKKGKMEDLTEELQAEELKLLGPKPTVYDTLPFQMWRGGKAAIIALPTLPGQIYGAYKERQEQKAEEERLLKEEEEEIERREAEKREKKERARQHKQRRYVNQYEDRSGNAETRNSAKTNGSASKPKALPKNAAQIWTDADLAKLSKLVKKFPPGTADRWEKVAEVLEREAWEVTKMAQKLKDDGFQVTVPKASQGVTGLESEKLIADEAMEYNNQADEDSEDESEETEDSDDENYGVYSCTTAEEYQLVEVKSKKKTKGGKAGIEEVEEAEDGSSAEEWSQEAQKALEAALSQFPKGSTERWERIAAKVPGKSKEECMVRYKKLAEIVKARKMAASSSATTATTSAAAE